MSRAMLLAGLLLKSTLFGIDSVLRSLVAAKNSLRNAMRIAHKPEPFTPLISCCNVPSHPVQQAVWSVVSIH